MIVNIILIMLATIALLCGCDYYIREKNKNIIRHTLFISSICVFMWCFGYAIMGFCKNTDACYIWRTIGLAGIIFFVSNEAIFVREITKSVKHGFTPIRIAIDIFGIICLLFVSRPEVVEFVYLKDRTAYYSHPAIGRTIEAVYISSLFLFLFIMAIFWLINSRLRREKEIIWILICAHFFLMFTIIPDTVLPSILKTPSFPSSCFGAFVCFIANLICADKFNAFNISLGNVSNYIFHNVDTSVIVIDSNHKLRTANDFAIKFLGIEDINNVYFSDLFMLPHDAKGTNLQEYINDLKSIDSINNDYSNKHFSSITELVNFVNETKPNEKVRLITCNNNTVCSVNFNTIYDKYDEPMCTVCMIYDLTTEEKMYDEVNTLKQSLQKDLRKKTKELEALTFQAVATIAAIIDAKDPYTKGHSERVALYSELIAQKIGWNDEEIKNLKFSALLHDIGKIGVPDAVLKKDDRLEPDEYELLKQHTNLGSDILEKINVIPDLYIGAKYHHEKFDGTGYPNGIKGYDIPIQGRIICIADSFDAMNTIRIYRDALSRETILKELQNGKGTQFDPDLLDTFLEIYQAGSF